MAFELPEVTEVEITKVNVRTELHGEERVLAVDLRCRLKGENTILDLLKPGLREHYYWNKAMTAGQEALPGVVIPLPNLRHPELPTENIPFVHGPKGKSRGYRFVRDYGTDEARWDFSDVAVGAMQVKELHEGGSASLEWTISYNGEELQDHETLNGLVRLGVEKTIHMKLLAPAELIAVGKGYRAGKPDTPPSGGAGDDAQGELVDGEGEDDGADADGKPEGEEQELDPATPIGALANAEAAKD